MVLAFNITPLLFFIPTAFGLATSALVGSQIGANNVKKARRIALISFFYSVSVALFVSSIFIINRDSIIRMFSGAMSLNKKAASNLKAYCLIFVIDAI
jgi:Na+-driven multidrug efflux pump